jgi:cysteinyl-tRNA synthetase
MEIKLFNTLTRKKEEFKPLKKGEVGMYSCGPTVYWYQHIGNLRTYVFSDILRRVLEFNGYKVKQVINVTDVGHLTSDEDEGEDKMEKAASKEGKSAKEIADFYFKIFREDFKKLNILEPWKWPRASEHIKEQVELIKKLEKKGFTYKTSDGIYFDSSKFKDYGKLGRINVKGLEKGKRIAFGDKKSKTDFALWKFSEEPGKRQQEWDSPWGLGFPGWHLECSAMSMKYLGETFDLHTGGEDHVQVHHTNEIAQSECATGKKFVNYWLHGAFLLNKGEKVSKSKGGLFTISELEEKSYNPLSFRYLCLLTHYRKSLNFSLENLDAAQNALERMKRKILEMKKEKHKGNDLTEEYETKFLEAINDDLNMPRALQVFWGAIDDFDFSPVKKLKLLEKFDLVLGFGIKDFREERVEIPDEVMELIEEREKLRAAKLWAEADLMRERIKEKGFLVEDKADGVKVTREN